MSCIWFERQTIYHNILTMNIIDYKDIAKDRGSTVKQSSSKIHLKINRDAGQIYDASSSGTKLSGDVLNSNSSEKISFDTVLNSKISGESNNKDETGRWTEYTIKSGDTIWDLAVNKYHVKVEDILRDNNIKDPRKIQPGDKIQIRMPSYPSEGQEVTASWYGRDYHGKAMANGDFYNMYAATIAHKDLPLGTQVELENMETGVKVRAVVTDRGPFIAGRDVDLSYGLARILSIDKKGVGKLSMRVIG
jgi:rare lipoprotein A (peptidoglycan hydrolase)